MNAYYKAEFCFSGKYALRKLVPLEASVPLWCIILAHYSYGAGSVNTFIVQRNKLHCSLVLIVVLSDVLSVVLSALTYTKGSKRLILYSFLDKLKLFAATF